MKRTMLAGLAVLAAGCSNGPGADTVDGGGPVEVVRHAYYPRLATEDYWETVNLGDAGSNFLLMIHPRIKTPAEGPWTATFRDPGGQVFARHRGLHVDVATANFTFLCSAARFEPGDWTIELEVEPDGLVSGERKRLYRFRVEAPS